MPDEPIGREQPSAAREYQEPTPEEHLEQRQIALQNDQIQEAPAEVESVPKPEIQSIEEPLPAEAPSLDEFFARAVDRQWEDISNRVAGDIDVGRSMNLQVAGHDVSFERTVSGPVVQIDGKEQESDMMRRFLELHAAELLRQITRQEQMMAEQQRTQAMEQERRRVIEQTRRRERIRANEREERVYEAKMDGTYNRQVRRGELPEGPGD